MSGFRVNFLRAFRLVLVGNRWLCGTGFAVGCVALALPVLVDGKGLNGHWRSQWHPSTRAFSSDKALACGHDKESPCVHVLYGTNSTSLSTVNDQTWHQQSPGIREVAASNDFFGGPLPPLDLPQLPDLPTQVPYPMPLDAGQAVACPYPTPLEPASATTQNHDACFDGLTDWLLEPIDLA